MTALDAIVLGIIQGLTEFLPVSSSAHLVIGESLLGVHLPGISFEVWLHFGTLIAVLLYYRKRLLDIARAMLRRSDDATAPQRRMFWALVIGTIPAGILGVTLKDLFETAFKSPRFSAAMLLVTALFLMLTKIIRNRQLPLTVGRGLLIGCAQAIAILPGISRSGSTISAGMFLGIAPAEAAEFSFLLSIPAVGGAFLLDMISAGKDFLPSDGAGLYLIGALASFIFGILAIHYLIKIVKHGRFFFFGFYCLVAGALALIFLP